MSDQPDIDIEAERKLYEAFLVSRDEWSEPEVCRSREPGATYAYSHSEREFVVFCGRARLAAEREREMVDLLREAQREGCTRCYSDAVGLPCCYPHSAQCLRITAALKKGPSDGR